MKKKRNILHKLKRVIKYSLEYIAVQQIQCLNVCVLVSSISIKEFNRGKILIKTQNDLSYFRIDIPKGKYYPYDFCLKHYLIPKSQVLPGGYWEKVGFIPEDDDSTRACLHFEFKLINIVNIQVTIVKFIITVPGCN